MFHRTLQVLGGAVCALLVAHVSPAFALGWSSPLGERTIVTAYGAEYGGHTHRGVDLAGDVGDAVRAPAAGTVVFAGSVPADGGGTCNAVTIELPSGDRVSLLPLSEVWVDEGAPVGAAEQVGALAVAGDDSSSGTHVHMSLRHDGVYVDPTAFLSATAAAPVLAPIAPAPEEPHESGDSGESGQPAEAFLPVEIPEGAAAAAGGAAVSTVAGGVESANGAASVTQASSPVVGSLAGSPSAASFGASGVSGIDSTLAVGHGSHEVVRDIGGQSAGALAVAGAGVAHTGVRGHMSSAWSAWPASVSGVVPAGAAALTACAFAGLAASALRMRRATAGV